eukprot:2120753-Alexandrium_andersonii.AAC.1
MSASLVGSEMCIRDSAWTCSEQALRLHWIRALCSPGARPSHSRKGCGGGCLLYTSDAADDM